MSEQIRARLILSKFPEDTEPVIVAAIDETIWEHWEPSEEDAWLKQAQRTWGMDPTDCEWSQVWAVFAPQDLVDAFATPEVPAGVMPTHERKERG